tara:strand:+ start:140 stop:478 length:339 start_codon:yes stop_codon:yes gene_type:complete
MIKDFGRKFCAFWIFVIFFWMWPYRLFTDKNNCYFWTLEKLITEGGKVKWYKSHLWYGYHCTWVSPLGEEWEYTLPKMRKTSLWKVMWYNGNVRKFTRGNNYFLNKKTERKE